MKMFIIQNGRSCLVRRLRVTLKVLYATGKAYKTREEYYFFVSSCICKLTFDKLVTAHALSDSEIMLSYAFRATLSLHEQTTYMLENTLGGGNVPRTEQPLSTRRR